MDFITYVIIIGIWILFGFWCKSLANKRGLNETLAFVIGFIFGLVAVIIYACLSETLEHKAQKQAEFEKMLEIARVDKKKKK